MLGRIEEIRVTVSSSDKAIIVCVVALMVIVSRKTILRLQFLSAPIAEGYEFQDEQWSIGKRDEHASRQLSNRHNWGLV